MNAELSPDDEIEPFMIDLACNADSRQRNPRNWPNYWAETLLVTPDGTVTFAYVEPERWRIAGEGR